jgi:Cu(I)/Ag(I) efflux system protein CusF
LSTKRCQHELEADGHGFQVKDRVLLDKLAVGKRVDFDFVQATNGYLVTAVK